MHCRRISTIRDAAMLSSSSPLWWSSFRSAVIRPWADVANELHLSPDEPPSAFTPLGEGACGTVYGKDAWAFKSARLLWSDDVLPLLVHEIRCYADLLSRGSTPPPYVPEVRLASFVDFDGVAGVSPLDRWQVLLVLRREGQSLAEDTVQKTAAACAKEACVACAAMGSLRSLHADGLLHGDVRANNFVLSAGLSAPSSSLVAAVPPLDAEYKQSDCPPSAPSSSAAAAAPRVRLIDLGHAAPFTEEGEKDEIVQAEYELTPLRAKACTGHEAKSTDAMEMA
jgi:serine/threonine protein kinase